MATTRTFRVNGMSCGHCKQAVESNLAALDGVTSATADVEQGTVRVEGEVDLDVIRGAVDDAGYELVEQI
jgi:copper chaperone CopZ